jgi:hypothetical protein
MKAGIEGRYQQVASMQEMATWAARRATEHAAKREVAVDARIIKRIVIRGHCIGSGLVGIGLSLTRSSSARSRIYHDVG